MKSAEEMMENFGSFRFDRFVSRRGGVGRCSHHTVANYVAARQEGRFTPGRGERRAMLIDAFLPKLEEWVEHSRGRIRADVVRDKLAALGFAGSERTTRRAVAEVKSAYLVGPAAGASAVDPGAGMWFQYDFGDGPHVDGVGTQLFYAWFYIVALRIVASAPTSDSMSPESL